MIKNIRQKFERHGMPPRAWQRQVLGGLLVVLGLFGFLPVLGFWMVPLGLIMLSADSPWLRRKRREWDVKLTRWWNRQRGRPDGRNGAAPKK